MEGYARAQALSVNNTRDKPSSSPCIGRCTLTTGDTVCRGCGRTEEEFRDWNSYTDERKIEVKRIAARRKRELLQRD